MEGILFYFIIVVVFLIYFFSAHRESVHIKKKMPAIEILPGSVLPCEDCTDTDGSNVSELESTNHWILLLCMGRRWVHQQLIMCSSHRRTRWWINHRQGPWVQLSKPCPHLQLKLSVSWYMVWYPSTCNLYNYCITLLYYADQTQLICYCLLDNITWNGDVYLWSFFLPCMLGTLPPHRLKSAQSYGCISVCTVDHST